VTHFPDVDRIEAVAQVWGQLFAQPPVGLEPLTVDDSTLIVLCQTPNLVAFVDERRDDLVRSLNHALDGTVLITAIRPVRATATEMYLARELLALKAWLRDFDVGF
jgi:hypothetical protein